MRRPEIVIAIIAAVVIFVLLKLIGMVVKFALVAAALGFLAGLVLGRQLRRTG